MKTLDYNKIEYWKKNKFNFDIGKYFNQSIELFSNNWGNFVAYSFVASLLLLISYITIIGPFIIMFPLLMGFLIGAEKADYKKNLVFNDFFGGFKNLGTFFLFNLSILFIYLIIMTPLFLFSFFPLLFGESENNHSGLIIGSTIIMFILMSVLIIFLFIFMIGIYLAPYLIYYGNLGVKDAIKTSIAITKNNFWWILLLVIITSFISSIGMIICYLGIFITFPISYIFTYFVLKDIILTDDEKLSEIDTLGTNKI
ncbi:hypothetical protein [Chishuiella sp.]|uniref:hypothetical protein n=1 Tax=Chishuiella sp. TaxID=1969467 RepID=UPI0028B17AE9|nr:hypothetical protein [Chishuiella sp.]